MGAEHVHYTPTAVNATETGKPFFTFKKGWWLATLVGQVVTPTDTGSTGTVSIAGDSASYISGLSGLNPKVDTYAAGAMTGFLLSAHDQVVTADETVTIGWTPGATPGATAPLLSFSVIFEEVLT